MWELKGWGWNTGRMAGVMRADLKEYNNYRAIIFTIVRTN